MAGSAETVQVLRFGHTSFSQGKNIQKQVIQKSACVIFGLVRHIILSYNR